MQRIIPFAIFGIVVLAVLIYTGQAQHDLQTLILLCGVLAVGEIIALLQLLNESRYVAKNKLVEELKNTLNEAGNNDGNPPPNDGKQTLESLKKIEAELAKLTNRVPADLPDENTILEKFKELNTNINEQFEEINKRFEEIEQTLLKNKRQILNAIDDITVIEESETTDDNGTDEENNDGNEDESIPAEPEPEESDEEENIPEEEAAVPTNPEEPSEEKTVPEEPPAVPAEESQPDLPYDEPLDHPHAILMLTAAISTTEPPQIVDNLSAQSSRTTMEYSGGNRWRHDFGPITEPVTFTIYKNNSEIALGDKITIYPGKQLKVKWNP
ncbi:MAG: hypothetical protein K6B46_06330 [Opitutales bacterium]|nr:hypothetical protein [Opitutales bacterium]